MLPCPPPNKFEEQIAENIKGNTKYWLKYISIVKVIGSLKGC